jgi:hypothetical protein
MSFSPPTFNLTCNIWRVLGVGGAYAAPDVTVNCNLSQGKRVLVAGWGPVGHPAPYHFNELLLPALTDIRSLWNGTNQDLVEVPAGSKRFYTVTQVDDVAKGFPNEYRLAMMLYLINGDPNLAGGPYPAPVPLP